MPYVPRYPALEKSILEHVYIILRYRELLKIYQREKNVRY